MRSGFVTGVCGLLATVLISVTPVLSQDSPPEDAATAAQPAEPVYEPAKVTLKDGSLFVGEILQLKGGDLKIKTAAAGEVTVKIAEVAAIRSDKPIRVVLDDGTELVGPVSPGDEGMINVAPKSTAAAVPVALSSVTAVNPTEEKPVKLKGNINFGGSITDGNTNTRAASFNGEFIAQSKQNRLTLRGAWNYSDDSDGLIARNTKGTIKYDYFVTERLFLYVGAFFEEDRFQDLNLRTALSAGPGYQWIKAGDYEDQWRKGLELYTEAGIAFFNEDFRTSPDQRYVSARWALKLDWPFVGNMALFHYHEGFPGLERLSDVFITTEQGIRFKILEGFNATLQVNWRWDNTPSPGFDRSDTIYLATLGYTFDF